MKTILTLLFSFIALSTVFAQTDAEREEAKRVILGEKRGSTSKPKTGNDREVISGGEDRTVYGERDRRYPDRYPTNTSTSRERKVYEINREYDAKINSIRANRTLSASEKERIIRQLESDRRRKLDRLNDRYKGNRERSYEDHDDKKSKKYKSNNGNHYGWQKGKGNPHKRSNQPRPDKRTN